MSQSVSEWGRKAADLYEADYARRYRQHDEELGHVEAYRAFCGWLDEVCGRFRNAVDVLDLGCGTGRYFAALRNVNTLVGLDASAAMLAEAANPIAAEKITAKTVQLVEGDALTAQFPAGSFDLVYSIGVLAEHTPLDARIVANVRGWLRPGGRFAFTTVHPDSASIPKTAGRAIGHAMLPFSPGPVRHWLHDRLTAGGQYADELLIVERLADGFTIESMTRLESEAHLHCLCVAVKAGEAGWAGRAG
ncbi:MAG TPA: methyltransferase domain-containing protein [Vicinamibacterales bacterium]|nr:methyltransferase domain-containing protein [Vicinamibacterales bacterium]